MWSVLPFLARKVDMRIIKCIGQFSQLGSWEDFPTLKGNFWWCACTRVNVFVTQVKEGKKEGRKEKRKQKGGCFCRNNKMKVREVKRTL